MKETWRYSYPKQQKFEAFNIKIYSFRKST